MRTLVALVLLTVPAVAECKIDNWRYSINDRFNRADLQGTATCPKGRIVIRAFDPSGKWIGNVTGSIDGYAFAGSLWAEGPVPKNLQIKYTIEPR